MELNAIWKKNVPKVSWPVVYTGIHAVSFCKMIAQKNLVSGPEFSRNTNTDFKVLYGEATII